MVAFLKKNWLVLSVATLTLFGFILSVVLVASGGVLYSEFQTSFMGAGVGIGYTVFFLGVTIYLVLGLCGLSKKIRGWFILATGALTTLFMLFGLIHAIDNWEDTYRLANFLVSTPAVESSWAKFVIVPVVFQLIVFGLFPLLFGIQRVLAVRKASLATGEEVETVKEMPIKKEKAKTEKKDEKLEEKKEEPVIEVITPEPVVEEVVEEKTEETTEEVK